MPVCFVLSHFTCQVVPHTSSGSSPLLEFSAPRTEALKTERCLDDGGERQWEQISTLSECSCHCTLPSARCHCCCFSVEVEANEYRKHIVNPAGTSLWESGTSFLKKKTFRLETAFECEIYNEGESNHVKCCLQGKVVKWTKMWATYFEKYGLGLGLGCNWGRKSVMVLK